MFTDSQLIFADFENNSDKMSIKDEVETPHRENIMYFQLNEGYAYLEIGEDCSMNAFS